MNVGEMKALCKRLEDTPDDTDVQVVLTGEGTTFSAVVNIQAILSNKEMGDTILFQTPEIPAEFINRVAEQQSAT